MQKAHPHRIETVRLPPRLRWREVYSSSVVSVATRSSGQAWRVAFRAFVNPFTWFEEPFPDKVAVYTHVDKNRPVITVP
jgi:hypothetical protein